MGSKVFVSVVFYKHCMTELMLWIWRVLKSAVFFSFWPWGARSVPYTAICYPNCIDASGRFPSHWFHFGFMLHTLSISSQCSSILYVILISLLLAYSAVVVSGAGKSIQDLWTVGKSIFVQHYKGCCVVCIFSSADGVAWFQAKIVQNKNSCLNSILSMHSSLWHSCLWYVCSSDLYSRFCCCSFDHSYLISMPINFSLKYFF